MYSEQQRHPRPSRRTLSRGFRRVAGFAAVMVVLASLFVGLPLAHYFVDFRHTPHRPLPPSGAGFEALGRMVLATPEYYTNRFLGENSLPKVHLEIAPEQWQKLQRKREQALGAGVLVHSDDDLVKATLRSSEGSVRVKVRLKGDYVDHLQGKRWSFRVEVKGGDSLFGMERFSLQAPYTRNFHREPLFFDFLRARGVLAPRYFFVELSVNGERIGVTALEEHFSAELLAAQQRQHGVILKFDEDDYWRAKGEFGLRPSDFSNWRNTSVDAFRKGRIRESEALSRDLASSVGLLRGAMRNRIPPARAFDAKLWGSLFAACEIWDASHVLDFRNVRMYFNPVTFVFEPIAFDATSTVDYGEARGFVCQGGQFALATHLFSDPDIRAAVFAAFRQFGHELHQPEFVRALQSRESQYLAQLRVDFPWLMPVDWEKLRARAADLMRLNESNYASSVPPLAKLEMPHSRDANYPAVVLATLVSNETETYLELANALSTPVEVSDLRFESDGGKAGVSRVDTASPPPPYRLAPSRWPEPPESLRIDFEAPTDRGERWSIAGDATVGEGERQYAFRSRAGFAESLGSPVPRSGLDQVLAQHRFLVSDPLAAGWLRVKPGSWDVDGWLNLPEGVGLRMDAGTTLRFDEGAALVARGPLRFSGHREAPVVLESRSADSGAWGGVVVFSPAGPSRWSHVVVRNALGVERGSWRLDAGVTFQLAEVEIRDSLFEGSQAAKSLRLIRSRFTLSRVTVRHAAADGLDVDFCEGRIQGVAMRGIGGDGIRGHDSKLSLSETHFEGIHGNAVALDGNSRLRARRLTVDASEIGVVTAGCTHALLEDSAFTKIRDTALLAFSDGAGCRGAETVARQTRIDADGPAARVEAGGSIFLNGLDVKRESQGEGVLRAGLDATKASPAVR